MAHRTRYVAVALAMLVLSTTGAGAQQQLDWSRCTISAQALCFEISLGLSQTQYQPGVAGTAFDISLRNLEGTIGTTPFSMWDFNFSLATDWSGTYTERFPFATFSGTAGFVVTADPDGDICQKAYFGCPDQYWGMEEWDALTPSNPNGRGLVEQPGPVFGARPYSIIGCDVPQDPGDAIGYSLGYFQTCGDGSVGFSFVLPGVWAFDDKSGVEIGYRRAVSTPSSGCIAVTQNQLNSGCLPTTAAPEPATLTLMATGLFSIAGFARTRRTREKRNPICLSDLAEPT